MANPGIEANRSELSAAIEEAQSLAREQIAAAWQLQIEKVREELESGWRERLDQIFTERFVDIETRLQSSFDASVDQRVRRSRSDVTSSLNQTSRRLRGAESRDEWIRTLIEAAVPFCGKAVLFPITPKGIAMGDQPAVPLTAAPAFGTAVESKDTVVAVGTPGELSGPISAMLSGASTKKIYLFPIVVRQNVVAVLYAEPGEQPVDVSALELLASLAAASIETTETVVVRSPAADLIRISNASAAAPVLDQEQHLRAQRFARTRVAEILLHKVRQVRDGRSAGNLYGALKEEIEAGREAFRKEFIEACPSMVDYFHLELQRTLAKDSPGALGPEYPGPLPVGASPR